MMFVFDELLKTKKHPLIMGIINITPDSFSDGAVNFNEYSFEKTLNEMIESGADIIDIGACSTAPGSDLVSEEEEIERLERFLPIIKKYDTDVFSVDTFRTEVISRAFYDGIRIFNDESGKFSFRAASLVREYSAGWITMHTDGRSSREAGIYPNGVVNAVHSYFNDFRQQAEAFGIPDGSICFDIGIGFGKTRENDLELLKNISAFDEFAPLLVGVSRKRIIGELTGESIPSERDAASAAAASICISQGAAVIRTHNVKATSDAVKIAEATGEVRRPWIK